MGEKFRILCRKNEDFENVVKLFWEKYAEKYNSELELELVPLHLPELHDAILTKDFDLAHVNTDWLAESWEDGCLENLAELTEKDPPEDYPEGWPASLLGLQTFPDGLAGIPFHDGPECLIYRKDLFENEAEKAAFFEKYGYALEPPSTWEQFADAAEFFNRPEDGIYGTLFALYPDGHNNIFDFSLQLWSRGGELTDADGRVKLNSPEAANAMKHYRALIKRDFVHPRSREIESIESSRVFARGEAAMMVNWFGFATMCETTEGSRVKGKVGIKAVPHGAETDEPVSLNVYYTWSISSASKHKKEAYDYIKNAVTAENDINLPLMGAVGCRISTCRSEKVNEVIPYYSMMEEIHKYAKTLPRTRLWHDIANIIDGAVVNVLNTDRAEQDILDEAQVKVDALYATGEKQQIDAIIYESCAGHTKEYAELLSGRTGIKAYALSETETVKGKKVIFMGWLMASGIKGYKKAAKLFDVRAVCAVGMAGISEEYEQQLKKQNGVEAPLFYLQGGFDMTKLKGMYRFMMKTMSRTVGKKLQNKPDRTAEEEEMLKLMTEGGNCVCAENLARVESWLS